ncbi:MAG: hypothetical protein V8S95_10950 [Odoribacter sp.]
MSTTWYSVPSVGGGSRKNRPEPEQSRAEELTLMKNRVQAERTY